MLFSQQLAPTVGPTHSGVEFLKGFHLGIDEARDWSDVEEPAQDNHTGFTLDLEV